MMVKNYDEKSLDLAEHFLADDPSLNTIDKCHHLAVAIQQGVEDWIKAEHLQEQAQLRPCKNQGNVECLEDGSCLRCFADSGEECRVR